MRLALDGGDPFSPLPQIPVGGWVLTVACAVAAAVLVACPAPPCLCRVRRRPGRCPGHRRAGGAGGYRGGDGGGGGGRGRRRPPPAASLLPAPMLFDLVAEVLASGAAPLRALTAVGECLDRAGDPAAAAVRALADQLGTPALPAPAVAGHPPVRAGSSRRPVPGTEELLAALDLSATTGVGPVALIRAAAEEERRRTHAEQVRAAHRLGVLVLLPTGLCLLPAFLLLTVVPLVLDLLLG